VGTRREGTGNSPSRGLKLSALDGIDALAGEPVKFRLTRLFVASRASPHVREAESLWILKSRPAVIVDVGWPGKQAGFLAYDISHPPLVDAMRTG